MTSIGLAVVLTICELAGVIFAKASIRRHGHPVFDLVGLAFFAVLYLAYRQSLKTESLSIMTVLWIGISAGAALVLDASMFGTRLSWISCLGIGVVLVGTALITIGMS